jgi:GNAT superfamily N-acetyltransferase
MIEQLSERDLSHNVQLAQSVGWHDSDAEWRVLYRAALVLGIREQSRLVAQGALGRYGAFCTLAKMVVSPEHQRRGLGAQLLDRLLADAAGLPVGLCATEQGAPLYGTRGFRACGEIVILAGVPRPGTGSSLSDVSELDVETAVELDRRFTGVDRSRMLRARVAEASVALASGPGLGAGFALATPQGPLSLVGPILAESEQTARALCLGLFARLHGLVRIDVPVERHEFRAWLTSLGLERKAQRVEMALGAERLPWQPPQRFALSTQAWG